jgi:prephenate dehydrogenase
MGVSAARADLFQGAVCVVTPTARSSPGALRKVEQLWRDVGGQILRLSPKHHDQLVARSSHLPHVLAATLAEHVLDTKHGKEQGLLCAGGFRDTTRIAGSSPEMWRDIALMNRKNLLRELKAFIRGLRRLQGNLLRNESSELEQFLSHAKRRRDNWHPSVQNNSNP